MPRAGIDLIKPNVNFTPVGVAEFRTHEIPFDMIFKSLRSMLSRLPLQERNTILGSWDNLRDNLQNTQMRRSVLPTMDITKFPSLQDDNLPELMDALIEPVGENIIHGNLVDEIITEGRWDEVIPGTDVVVYTRSQSKRPWVGRVCELFPEDGTFSIHWYVRQGKRTQFHALMNSDGSPSLEIVDLEAIMFWEMSEYRTENKYTLSNYWLTVINGEYKDMDQRQEIE